MPPECHKTAGQSNRPLARPVQFLKLNVPVAYHVIIIWPRPFGQLGAGGSEKEESHDRVAVARTKGGRDVAVIGRPTGKPAPHETVRMCGEIGRASCRERVCQSV